MQFSDIGIVLKGKRFKENSLIVTIFTKNHGIYSGILANKKRVPILEGCFVDLVWRGRLEEHLGVIKYDVIDSYISKCLLNKTKFYAFRSIISLINKAFKEKEIQTYFFEKFNNFLRNISQAFSMQEYITIELDLLKSAGYRIDLTKCVVTSKKTDLVYVSPRSAKAVCKSVGDPYKSKLLLLPENLVNPNILPNCTQIKDSLKLTSYFIKKHILQTNFVCGERDRFLNHLFTESHLFIDSL